MVALSLVLGGTAVAATVSGDKKADTKLVKKLAPSLSVKHATTADTATSATNATNATNATHATNATNATNATHATSATNATHATSAQTAAVSNAIGNIAYVAGNIVDAPANGGSGYAESLASDATCPSGMYVIGSGANVGLPGTEIDDETVFATTGNPGPNRVEAYFDNFANTDNPDNYAEAICATVNSHTGFLTKLGLARH
jgi:hypothetical protein